MGGTALAQAPLPTAKVETPHLAAVTSTAESRVAPGGRVVLFVDVAPKPTFHLYAPGEKDAIPVTVALSPDDAFTATPPEFPKAEKYFFEPLKITQLVFSKPFRISQHVTVAGTPALRERARTGGSLEIKGTLRYQACDDKVCYMPKTVPLTWTLTLRTDDRTNAR
jgi:hypothetical protein